MASVSSLTESMMFAPEPAGDDETENPLFKSYSGSSNCVEKAVVLSDAAESLLAKLYELANMAEELSENYPKLTDALTKKFPQHPKKLVASLQKVDKAGFQKLQQEAAQVTENLQTWYDVLEDVQSYYKAVQTTLDEIKNIILFGQSKHMQYMHRMLFQISCEALRVQILAASTPYKEVLQLYALASYLLYKSNPIMNFENKANIKSPQFDALVQFCVRFDAIIPTLQNEFRDYSDCYIVSIKDYVGPFINISLDVGFLKKHSVLTTTDSNEYKLMDKAEVSQQQMCEGLMRAEEFREWILWTCLVCPILFASKEVLNFARDTLKTTMLLPVFRDVMLWIHAELLVHSYPKMKEILKELKVPREEIKVDMKAAVNDSFNEALEKSGSRHVQRREFAINAISENMLRLEQGSEVNGDFVSQLLATMAFARAEAMWYFTHADESLPSVLPGTLTPKKGTTFAKVTVGAPSKHVLRLIGAMAAYAKCILQREETLSSALKKDCKERISRINHVLKNITDQKTSVLSKSIEFILNIGFGENDESLGNLSAMRMTWLRYASASYKTKLHIIDDLSLKKHDIKVITEVFDTVNSTYLIDRLTRQVTKSRSLKQIYFFVDKLDKLVEASFDIALDIGEHIEGILDMYGMFLHNNHPRCVAIVDEDILPPVQHFLERLSRLITRTLLEMEMEEYAFATGGLNLKKVKEVLHERNKLHKAGGANPPSTEVAVSSSFLIKYAMVCAVIAALDKGSDFALPSCAVKLRAFVHHGFKTAFESFLGSSFGRDSLLPEPSALKTSLTRFIILIQSFQPATALDLSEIVRNVLYEEVPSSMEFFMPFKIHNRNSKPGNITKKYAEWYVSEIIHEKSSVGVMYSPVMKLFAKANTTGARAAFHASVEELGSLIGLFGFHIVIAVWNEIYDSILQCFAGLSHELKANQAFIAEVIFATNQKGTMKGLANLETKSFVLDEAMEIAKRLGRCALLLDMLSRAALEKFGKKFPGLLGNLTESLEDEETPNAMSPSDLNQLHLLNYAFGNVPVGQNPVLQSAFDKVSHTLSFDLVEHLFSALMCHPVWKSVAFHPETGTLDNDMLSLGAAFRQVCYLMDKPVGGPPTEEAYQNVRNRFESFLDTATPLLFADVSGASTFGDLSLRLDDATMLTRTRARTNERTNERTSGCERGIEDLVHGQPPRRPVLHRGNPRALRAEGPHQGDSHRVMTRVIIQHNVYVQDDRLAGMDIATVAAPDAARFTCPRPSSPPVAAEAGIDSAL